MNTPLKIAATALVVTSMTLAVIQWQNFILEVQKRHPEMSADQISKAYRIFLKELATGHRDRLDGLTIEQLEMLIAEFKLMRDSNN